MNDMNFDELKEEQRQLVAELRKEVKMLTEYLDELEPQIEKWTTFEEAGAWYDDHDIESKLEHIELFR